MNQILYGCHISNSPNIGDQVASPVRYLDFGRVPRIVDYRDLGFVPDLDKADVIFGGGGMLHPGVDAVLQANANGEGKRIIWGIGINYHDQRECNYPAWLNAFDLVGMRDVSSGVWVPCPSCLHPEFRCPRHNLFPKHPFVIYEHYETPVVLEGCDPAPPSMNNKKPARDFWRVLDFLASGDTVISNSYHGLYWATLLGRKTLCYEPFSNRFSFTPWQQVFCDRRNWKDRLPEVKPSAFTLEQAITANLMFRNRVEEILFAR